MKRKETLTSGYVIPLKRWEGGDWGEGLHLYLYFKDSIISIIKMDLNSKTFNCFQRWLRIHGYGLVLSSIILFIFRIFITFLTINMAENIFLAELPLFY